MLSPITTKTTVGIAPGNAGPQFNFLWLCTLCVDSHMNRDKSDYAPCRFPSPGHTLLLCDIPEMSFNE
jgi:hypothetical protein